MAVRFFHQKEETHKEYDVRQDLTKIAKLKEQVSKIAAFSSNTDNTEASNRVAKVFSVWENTLNNINQQIKTDAKEEAPSTTPGFRR